MRHPTLRIDHCVIFAMATPSFPLSPARSSPPVTPPPPVWVLFFTMYNLGDLLFGLLLIRSFQPCAVVSCGARLCPRKRPSGIIVWRGTTAASPMGKTPLKGFQGGNTKEGDTGPCGSDDNDTEDALH